MAYLFVTVWAAIFYSATVASSIMTVALLFSPWPWVSLILLAATAVLYPIAAWLVRLSDSMF